MTHNEVRQRAEDLIQSARRALAPKFHPDTFGLGERKQIEHLITMAKAHHAIQEYYCDTEMTPEMQRRIERKEERLEATIRAVASQFGFTARFDGDPRGFTVKLFGHEDMMNTWGGKESGYGI